MLSLRGEHKGKRLEKNRGNKKQRPISRVLSLCGHLSRESVTRLLKRSTGRVRGPPQPLPLILLPMGFARPVCYHTAGALLPHLFTVTAAKRPRLCVFCGTFRRVAPPGCYPASCPMEPGLSSAACTRNAAAAATRPSASSPFYYLPLLHDTMFL